MKDTSFEAYIADQAMIGRIKKSIKKEERDRVIDKACEWLKNTLYIHTEINEDKDWGETKPIDWVTSDYDTVEDFINGFIKAIDK